MKVPNAMRVADYPTLGFRAAHLTRSRSLSLIWATKRVLYKEAGFSGLFEVD